MQTSEFLVSARLDTAALDDWVAAGWLAPHVDGAIPVYSEMDVARAHLIHDLRRMGVNDEGVPVILDLVDQVHGLRRVLRELMSAADARADSAWRRSHAEAFGLHDGKPGGTPSCRSARNQTG